VSGRRITTAVTLTVLVVVLAAMAVYGFRAATAPLPGADGPADDDCSTTEKEVKRFVRRDEVQVSVFNAGDRKGFAGTMLERLEEAGFRAGNAGNAPAGAKVPRVVVWTTEDDDASARLVARSFGPRTRVVVTETDLGPGVDVLVGNRLRGVDKSAPKKLKLPAAVETCVEVD